MGEITGDMWGMAFSPITYPVCPTLGSVQPPVTLVTGEFEDLVTVGLRQLLDGEPNFELRASNVPIGQLSAAIERHRPAVALLNFGSLPSPVRVYELHEAHPETRIVILANRPSSAECNQMLALGATGCISKETQARDIINAIHLASRGMHVLPRVAPTSGLGDRRPLPGPDIVTPREADVLALLQEGRSNAEIAAKLTIGVETVRTHARNIYAKLGVTSRRDLASIAREPAA